MITRLVDIIEYNKPVEWGLFVTFQVHCSENALFTCRLIHLRLRNLFGLLSKALCLDESLRNHISKSLSASALIDRSFINCRPSRLCC